MEEKEILTEAPTEELPAEQESAQTADEAEQTNAEKQPDDKPARGRSRVLRGVLYALTAVLAIAAAAAVRTVLHVREMVDRCAETKLSEGLTAEETLRRYFDYWDEGNNVGMQLTALPDANSAAAVSKNYVAELDLLCDIKLKSCKKLSEDDYRYSGCSETAAYEVTFTYDGHFGAGDKALEGENAGWRFYLAKLTEDDEWRIYSVIRPQ